MKLHIITIGEPKLGYAKAGLKEYLGRLKHYHSLRVTHIPDKHNDTAYFQQAIGSAYSVALVIDGPQLDSFELAHFIEQRNQEGREVAFLIGGPDGLPAEIIAAANRRFGLSRLTFPHDLAMIMLAETLYRSSTIAAGQPYHH